MAEGAPAPGASTRAQRDDARRQRAEGAQTRRSYARGRSSIDDRPPAPWGSFPLSELAVLVSIVLLIGSFVVRGDQGVVMFAAGLGAFGISFWAFREAFKHRSGGVSFR
jgi:hypothetical protein